MVLLLELPYRACERVHLHGGDDIVLDGSAGVHI
jgi:hypothetical protein